MKTICLRRNLLVILTVLIGWAHIMAQSGPLVPKSESLRTKNSTILSHAFKNNGGLNIPVYLNSAKNINIKYCWYETSMVFGSRVRTSEEPYRIEEGTYTNGRLTMYTKKNDVYELQWSPDGEITAIVQYNKTTGAQISNTTIDQWITSGLSSNLHTDAKLVDYKTINCPGKGLTMSSSVSISNVLLTYIGDYHDFKCLGGYRIEGAYLYYIQKGKELRKPNGQLTKAWMERNLKNEVVKIMNNGSFDTKEVYDVTDKVRCSAFEN